MANRLEIMGVLSPWAPGFSPELRVRGYATISIYQVERVAEFVCEAENIEIVAVIADWWERECRPHGSGRAWRIPGVAYAEEAITERVSIAGFLAGFVGVGTRGAHHAQAGIREATGPA